MLSVKEIRGMAAKLPVAKFRAQLGPFALIQRPEQTDLESTAKMGLPRGAQHTAMARPEDISRGILSLLFEFEELQVCLLRPLAAEDELSVGRLPDGDVVVDHPSVSKRHAVLKWDESRRRCTVKDLGSTNGTFLNDGRLSDREVGLRDGDILSFGDVQYWFVLSDTLHAKLLARDASYG